MVDNEETLFRRIGHESVSYDDEGNLRVSSQAFTDRFLKPSVNRAKLAPNPESTKLLDEDGVLQLVADEIRRIDSVIRNPLAPPNQQVRYQLDVIERPIVLGNPDGEPENAAHAQIESDPELENRSRFDKVKDALARLAERRPLLIAPQPPNR